MSTTETKETAAQVTNFIRNIIEDDLARNANQPRFWCGHPAPYAEQAEKEALAQRNALLEAISGAKNSISDQNDEYSSSNHSIASSTSIRSASLGNGDGSGSGLAVANYGQIIRSRYNNAWVSPSSLKNPNLQTTAKIVILRNGTIQSSRITKYSGDASLDESVQKVLDTIIKVPPFPKSSKDTTRTYTIHFSLRGIDTD